MKTKVKICGITDPQIAKYSVGLGVGFIGLIFFAKSPRNITYKKAAEIYRAVSGNAKVIAVMVNPSDHDIKELLSEFTPDYIQLHGNESVDRVREIKEKFGLNIIKAISVSSKCDIKKANQYLPYIKFLLFDAKPPKNSNLPGGNAISFDWNLLKNIKLDKKYFLSGGLNINNIEKALEITNASHIDISSGVEYQLGIKSKRKIFDILQKLTNGKK
jgi:phosphoribosylanthranilate isomerase